MLPPHGASTAVRIPVRAPEVEGPASLRAAVYFQNNVVQSLVLTADVVADARDSGALIAEIDFTLAHDLRAIGERAPRALSVLMNEQRLHFLAKGNLLGLGYSAYCSADLKLVA